jgi:regulator of chromosome condensation
VACGGLHNAVVTEYGQVYTWGCDDDGSLGRKGDESVPFLVDKLKDVCVINIACGDGQTIAVSSSGDVYGWGCYKDKEGKKWFNPSSDGGPIRRAQDTPMLIQGVSGVLDIACGSSFNVARCKNGAVYSWGIGTSSCRLHFMHN